MDGNRSDPSRQAKSTARGIRADLIIATLALLASAGATIAVLVQTSIVGNQLSASVWPYLSIDSTFNSQPPRSWEIYVRNAGLGPALIRTVRLSVDRHRVTSLRKLLETIESRVPVKAHRRAQFTSIGTGTVIPAGGSLRLAQAASSSSSFVSDATLLTRVDLTICYCSILKACWIVDSHDVDFPRETASCSAAPTTLQY